MYGPGGMRVEGSSVARAVVGRGSPLESEGGSLWSFCLPKQRDKVSGKGGWRGWDRESPDNHTGTERAVREENQQKSHNGETLPSLRIRCGRGDGMSRLGIEWA